MPGIAIVLTNGVADWECAFLNGIGSIYNGIETVSAAPNGAGIVSQGGLRTTLDESPASLKLGAFDALILFGDTVGATDYASELKQAGNGLLEPGETYCPDLRRCAGSGECRVTR